MGLLDRRINQLAATADLTNYQGILESRREVIVTNLMVALGAAFNALTVGTILIALDEPTAGFIAFATAAAYLAAPPYFFATGNAVRSSAWILVASFVSNVSVHIVLGGFADSGATLAWGIMVCTFAVFTQSTRFAAGLTALYTVTAVVLVFFEGTLRSSRGAPDSLVPGLLAADFLVATLVMLVPALSQLLGLLGRERERSERLLLNVLPEEIAARLKNESDIIADQYPECTVLFADIAGFTEYSRRVSAEGLVGELNEIFSAFDELAARLGVEKIKTIGDGYMAVAGAPMRRPDHVAAVCDLGLGMLEAMEARRAAGSAPLHIRIGINTGPLVAGVIGTSKFSYDLWGDTVNMASRMESNGVVGEIQVTRAVLDATADRYTFTDAGVKDIKGEGPTPTYLLRARRGGGRAAGPLV